MQQFAQMGFPEMYEQALVRPLFQPWAEHLVRAADTTAGDRVIDIACGTGIVARTVRDIGVSGIVGVDVNAGMLAVARDRAPDIDWRIGDATALPVPPDERYDVVLCQQGLQFFADRAAAAAELRRVLVPGGRLAASTWRADEEMPVLHELRRIAEQRVGPIVDRRHSFPDAGELERLLLGASFADVRVTAVTKTIRFAHGPTFVFLNAMALVGMSAASQELSEESRVDMVKQIVANSQRVVDEHGGPAGLAYDIGANVVTAVAA
jgi:ubiquinone/menaquinone biosynthesis C-methylase UbiE